ncbi:gamma carbonic anhydrase family protein [Temperatibacter marinus]|uniref:Gamma carbonic anhydrase family protein n=1 Tax=Temperatibacter marinus TaxID=1456591 RepID=A0AA52EEJ4_9PROT|nr:gamma carbonic anhydrase family protein [Temperatibacter marinus]WND02203.1 gamma carbonic anhydrase family protein [Temperatibacter marinus]
MTPLKRETDLGGTLTPFQSIWPEIEPSAYVFHGAQVVGDVHINALSSIWHNVVIRGDVNYIRIGKRTNIQDGTIIHVSTNTYPTLIGDDVLIAHMAMLHGCTLENNSFVGMGAIVMDNCIIETDGMLAAGAMLTAGKVIKSGEMWAGRPAKFMRLLTQDEIEKNRSMAHHYQQLAEQHRADSKGEKGDQYPPKSMKYAWT